MTIQAAERRGSPDESLGLTAKDIVPTPPWATALSVLRDLHVRGWTFRSDDEGILLNARETCVMNSTKHIPFAGVAIRPDFRHRSLVETT